MMRTENLSDRFIDLRIALESLFLPQQPDQQLSSVSPLPVHGSWAKTQRIVAKSGTYYVMRTIPPLTRKFHQKDG